jgi:hypothetical protein
VVCHVTLVLKEGGNEQTCRECRDNHPYFQRTINTWEKKTIRGLRAKGVHYTSHDSTLPCVQKGRKQSRRPDFVFTGDIKSKSVLLLEIDPDHHRYENVRCENVRLEELKEGLGGCPLRILRVNPTDSKLLEANIADLVLAEMATLSQIASLPYGMEVVYVGYPLERIEELEDDLQCELGGVPFARRLASLGGGFIDCE